MSSDLHATRVVVGIDFGTSRSGYAYAFRNDQRVIGRTEWPGQPMPYIKTLTQILYSPDQKVEAWGYEAQTKFVHLYKKDKRYILFQNFKMCLREATEKSSDGPILSASNGEKFLVLNLIADYLCCIKEFARQDLDNATSGVLKDQEILWCLTIPAIWTDTDKQLMRRAAQKSGLIGTNHEDADRLLLVLEPEAAAIACYAKDKSLLKPGIRFMVVDCGGGTVDITVYEIDSQNDMREIVEGTGGPYGSTYVDLAFLDYLKQRLTSEVVKRFHDDEPIDYLEMLADWERVKCNFDPSKSSELSYFPLRSKLYKLLTKNYADILEKLADEQNGEDENIQISNQVMQSIFNPVLEGLMSKIDAALSRIGSQGCNLIFLVGGFSASPLLRQRIQERFFNRVQKIVMPPYPGHTIVEGAVCFGLNPSAIRARRSRFTYGTDTVAPFDPEYDDPGKRYYSSSTENWCCAGRFSAFVLSGDCVEVGERITRSYSPSRSDQKQMKIALYATTDRNARYVDEEGVKKIGEMQLKMPDIIGEIARVVEISMYFGKTEIRVEAKDTKSGQTCQVNLRFSTEH